LLHLLLGSLQRLLGFNNDVNNNKMLWQMGSKCCIILLLPQPNRSAGTLAYCRATSTAASPLWCSTPSD
jgi:hypothetical protein